MKIAVCTPVHSFVTMDYASSLAGMVHYTDKAEIVFNGAPVRPDIQIIMNQSSVLPQIRNQLARAALDSAADYLLWIDSDMVFPMDALLRALSLNLAVVGANYLRRGPVDQPTALGLDHKPVWTTREAAEAGLVEEVWSAGLGFCLIDMQVMRKLAEESEPFFALEMFGDGTDLKGEDVFFFERIRKAGFPVHVDHVLSLHVGHAVQRILTFRT